MEVDNLPNESYIRKGYFLIEDVTSYLKDGDADGLFDDSLSPEVYAAKLLAEAKLGDPKPVTNEYGNTYTPHGARDYMYFTYPDYTSKEYDAFLLRNVAHILAPFSSDLPKGARLVVVLDEG